MKIVNQTRGTTIAIDAGVARSFWRRLRGLIGERELPAGRGLVFPRNGSVHTFWMRFPIMFLVVACLVIGIIPGLTVGPVLHVAVSSVLGDATPEYSLAVWHGFTVPFAMSLVALASSAASFASQALNATFCLFTKFFAVA